MCVCMYVYMYVCAGKTYVPSFPREVGGWGAKRGGGGGSLSVC